MTYKGHGVGGLAAAALVWQIAPTTGLLPLAVLALWGVIGGWTPDLDAPGAKMSRKLWPLPWLIYMLLYNPLTWALAGRGRVGERLLPEPPRRRALRAWFVSRWWVRWIMGPERAEALFRSYNGHRKPVPLALRLFWNPLVRGALGRERALYLYHYMKEGRSRMRTLAGHRGISHTWAMCLASTLVFAPLSVVSVSLLFALWRRAFGTLDSFPTVGGVLAGLPQDIAFPVLFCLSFAAGYLSHILLDSGSKSGTRPHWPLSDRKFWILPERFRYITAR